MSRFSMMTAITVLGVVSACAQQEEPTPITPQIVFDKFGNVSSGTCEEGYIYIPGAVPEPICLPEERRRCLWCWPAWASR